MYPVSELFDAAVRRPHTITRRVEVWSGAERLTSRLAFSAGSLTLDRADQVYAKCEVTAELTRLAGLIGVTTELDVGDLDVYGVELRCYRGIRYPTGETEEIPLGRFLIEEIKRSPINSTEVTVAASGPRGYVRDDRFLKPYSPAAGSLLRDQIVALISASRPDDEIDTTNLATLSATTAVAGTVWDEDRLGAIDEMSRALGITVYPDRDGIWRLDPIGDPATATPVWTVDAGPAGVLTAAELSTSRESVWNAVVARGEATDATKPPVQAVAYHTVATSPTRWGGPFGHRPRFYSSPLLKTVTQCQSAANSLLRSALLADTVLDLSAVPHPGLDPDDAVTVVMPDGSSEVHMVDAVTIPLSVDGPLTIVTRRRADPET